MAIDAIFSKITQLDRNSHIYAQQSSAIATDHASVVSGGEGGREEGGRRGVVRRGGGGSGVRRDGPGEGGAGEERPW